LDDAVNLAKTESLAKNRLNAERRDLLYGQKFHTKVGVHDEVPFEYLNVDCWPALLQKRKECSWTAQNKN
jgi:hypothetical protein